jgi:hypothetical protein
MDDDDNQISELPRRDIFDALRLENVQWAGRLGETDFLSRVFDLTKLPSEDYRASNMLGDVSLHRENFHDPRPRRLRRYQSLRGMSRSIGRRRRPPSGRGLGAWSSERVSGDILVVNFSRGAPL